MAALELGVQAKTTGGIEFGASYSGQIGGGLRDHGVRADVRIPF